MREWSMNDLERMLREAKREDGIRKEWYPIWTRERRLDPKAMERQLKDMQDITAFLSDQIELKSLKQGELFAS